MISPLAVVRPQKGNLIFSNGERKRADRKTKGQAEQIGSNLVAEAQVQP
jgi:hypothetical protein